jgi:hypothetical protein
VNRTVTSLLNEFRMESLSDNPLGLRTIGLINIARKKLIP